MSSYGRHERATNSNNFPGLLHGITVATAAMEDCCRRKIKPKNGHGCCCRWKKRITPMGKPCPCSSEPSAPADLPLRLFYCCYCRCCWRAFADDLTLMESWI